MLNLTKMNLSGAQKVGGISVFKPSGAGVGLDDN